MTAPNHPGVNPDLNRPPMPASDRPDPHQRPRFAPGARVRVRDSRPERLAPMHLRTPHYVRGRTGTVERALGAFANPEAIAFARPGEPRMLYHVVFDQPPIWNEGAPGDTVMIEIFEHWLEEAP